MSYRIATLTLSIIVITFAHKKAFCDAQVTGKTACLNSCTSICLYISHCMDPIDVTSSTGNKFVVGFPINGSEAADQLYLFITNPESSAVSFMVTPIDLSRNISNSSTIR